MRARSHLYSLFASFVLRPAVSVPLEQVALQLPSLHTSDQRPLVPLSKSRPLTGKFLHFTDFHPDRFYEIYSATTDDAACHRGEGPAGIYGAETSDCDSPIALVNKTFDWIAAHLKDEVDFVVWTGDSARHDNDDKHPRSVAQVTELNEFMVGKMMEVFGKKNGDEDDDDPTNDFQIPIVPNLGNNDVLPHNIMRRGPNEWTREYRSMWRQFIPEAQRHQFEQGGWFYVEVIPRKLAVFSINTMYFFRSNAAVDGCAAHSEPGYRQFEWLRIQLQFLRDRGMKAILIGHVPPARVETKQQWDETCWQKYTLWMRQYRDVIVTGIWGHMNYDHFFLQDFDDILKDTLRGRLPLSLPDLVATSKDEDMHTMLSSDYFVDLRQQWSKLPKPPKSLRPQADLVSDGTRADFLAIHGHQRPQREANGWAKKGKGKNKESDKRKQYLKDIGGPYAEAFAASFVSASVVPNLFPTIRVFEYNITGLEDSSDPVQSMAHVPTEHTLVGTYGEDADWNDGETVWEEADLETEKKKSKKKKKKKKKKKIKKYKFTVPKGPSKSSPPGPAYSPQTFSLLRFTQYFANLTHINNDFSDSAQDGSIANQPDIVDGQKWKSGKHRDKRPHDKGHEPDPKKFKFEVLYDTKDDDVYNLTDLTMPHILDLARRIGDFRPESSLAEASEDEFLGADAESDDLEFDAIEEDNDDDDVGEEKKKKKKHKKKKDYSKRNQAWYTFIRRAFVDTMDQEDIEDQFG